MRIAGTITSIVLFFSGVGSAEAQTPLPSMQSALERDCEGGDAAKCGQAAMGLIGTDRARARTLLETACSGEHRTSCNALAILLVSGEESARDYPRAIPLLALACDDGVGVACGSLSSLLYLGVGASEDLDRALSLAEQGCALDDPRACASLGVYLSAGDSYPRDLGRAGPALVKACVASVLDSCSMLELAAVDAVKGLDSRFPRSSGLELFGVACDSGRATSCGALGGFLSEGLFAAADHPRAARVLDRGCSLDHAMSCAFLAEAYRNGRGVAKDKTKARSLAEKALSIEPENPDAQRTLRRLK